MFDKTKLKALKEAKDKWEGGPVAKSLAKFPERKKKFT
ncbi:MAG: hypothetical protein H6Q51_2190, partial [Deltaproteobacteria bacterium]|nr:hypothetical protein [Deltaproteobacteria bacterium]